MEYEPISEMPYYSIFCFTTIKTKMKVISHFLSDIYYILAILVAMLLQLTENLEEAVETRFSFRDFPALVYDWDNPASQ